MEVVFFSQRNRLTSARIAPCIAKDILVELGRFVDEKKKKLDDEQRAHLEVELLSKTKQFETKMVCPLSYVCIEIDVVFASKLICDCALSGQKIVLLSKEN